MYAEQLFVGGVAVVLGVLALTAAATNYDLYYQPRKIRWVEDRWGRSTARCVYLALGAFLCCAGVAIAAGWTFSWQSPG